MKLVKLNKDLIIDADKKHKRKQKAGETYLYSEMRVQQLMNTHPEYIDNVVDLSVMYREYQGEDLTGKKLLVWRHGGMGDLMFMMPPLRLLKKKYPTCKLMVGMGSNFVDVYKNVPYINTIIMLPMNVKFLKEADYHLQFEGIIENNPEAETTNAYDLFLEKFKFNPSKVPPWEKRPDIFISDKEEKAAVETIKNNLKQPYSLLAAIQIEASSPIRTFPQDKMIDIVKELLEKDCAVILLGGKKQIFSSRNIVNSAINCEKKNAKKIIDGPGLELSMRISMALLRHCDFLVAPDSSMIHAAAAYGTPMVGLYAPFHSSLRMKYYYNAIGLNGDVACSPCFTHGHNTCTKGNPSPCFSVLKVSTILNAIDYLVKKTQNKKLPAMELYQHTEFNKVLHIAKQYMFGNGIDLGCGYMEYDNINITRVDHNPMCTPDINCDYETIAPAAYDYVVSSYTVDSPENLSTLARVCTNLLVDGGRLILYVGDSNIVSKIHRVYSRLSPINYFFISNLEANSIKTIMGAEGFTLIFENVPEWKEEYFNQADIEHKDYGVLTVWQKN